MAPPRVLSSRRGLSMDTIETYMTMFFLFFMFFFFIMMVARVQRSTNMSRFSATTHDMVFEIAERVSSTEYLVYSSESGQKKTAVFDPLKLSTANYEDLKDYLQEERIEWEIEVFDLEGEYRGKIDSCYKEYARRLEQECESAASQCRVEAGEEPTRAENEAHLKRCADGATSCRIRVEDDFSRCRNEARKRYDCSPGVVDWDRAVTSVDTKVMCVPPGDGCAAGHEGWLTPSPPPGGISAPNVHVNIDCMKCAYWRIGPSSRDLQLVRTGKDKLDKDGRDVDRQKVAVKRRIIYEFPAAISYYCDGRPTTLRTKPVHLAVLRVAALELDW